MTSYPASCTFAVVKMAFRENLRCVRAPQAYILRKQEFKESQIMAILKKTNNFNFGRCTLKS